MILDKIGPFVSDTDAVPFYEDAILSKGSCKPVRSGFPGKWPPE
jgi:hypothetical protein